MIAIKGMEMPKSCAECQMSYLIGWEVLYCHCILGVFGINDIDWMNERHKDCPLVEGEEKTRLIDALRTALGYNGLNERVKEWTELEPDKFKAITFTNQYDWKNMDEDESQLQLVWMICVLLYGDYGTSPRFGWIEDVKGFKEFCEKLAEDEE